MGNMAQQPTINININFALIRRAALVVVILVGIITSFYTVSADSQAVVLRFRETHRHHRPRSAFQVALRH